MKGTHPRRTYVGIKARRKRISDSVDLNESYRNIGQHNDMGRVTSTSLLPTNLNPHDLQSLYTNLHHVPMMSSLPPTKKKLKTDGTIINIHDLDVMTHLSSSNIAVHNNNALQNQIVQPDWRDQIYYWCGELAYDNLNSCLLWKGTWLGSFTGIKQL